MSDLAAQAATYVPGLLFLAFFGALLLRGLRKRNYLINASSQPGANPLNRETGYHRFTGTDHGISWELEVSLWHSEVDDGQANRRQSAEQWTRWTAVSEKNSKRSLLVMALSEALGSPSSSQKRGAGSALVATAALVAFSLYVRLNFGNERAAQIVLKPEHFIPLPPGEFGNAFAIYADPPIDFSNVPEAAREQLLTGYKGHRPSLLWTPTGMTFAWPVSLLDSEGNEDLTAYCVRIARLALHSV